LRDDVVSAGLVGFGFAILVVRLADPGQQIIYL
jgi:hypothetical protein